jgi:hypothetical protein
VAASVSGGVVLQLHGEPAPQTYEFRVRATNLAGDSGASNVASTRPMPPLPAAPTGLTARSLLNSSGTPYVALSWNPSSTRNVYYWIYLRLGPTWQRLPYPIAGTSLNLWYLHEGMTYDFKVTATNLAGDSGSSNVATATVKLYKLTMLMALTQPTTSSWNNWYYAKTHGGAPYQDYNFNWSSDNCSGPPKDFEDSFRIACQRHDFGFRNYKAMALCARVRESLNYTFWVDMRRICGRFSGLKQFYCARWADVYYFGVSMGSLCY